jgi:hypothetical protein
MKILIYNISSIELYQMPTFHFLMGARWKLRQEDHKLETNKFKASLSYM